jgi:hypothetical protein
MDDGPVKKALLEVLDWGTSEIRKRAIDTAPRGRTFTPPSGVSRSGRPWQVKPRPTETPIWRAIKRQGSFSGDTATGRVFVDTPHAKFVMGDTRGASGTVIRKKNAQALFLPLGVSVGGSVGFYALRNSAKYKGHVANTFLRRALADMRLGILSKARAAVARVLGQQYRDVRINMTVRIT